MQVCIATRLTECRQAVEAAVWRRKFWRAILIGSIAGVIIASLIILLIPSLAYANTNKHANYRYYAHGIGVKHSH